MKAEIPGTSPRGPHLDSSALKVEKESAAEAILKAWTALEVLAPCSFEDPRDLANGDETRIVGIAKEVPWKLGRRSRPGYRLYYQLPLGAIKLAPAYECLMERFGDSREERPRARGHAVLATVTLDSQGVAADAPVVSSFAWGVGQVLQGHLNSLADWPKIEPHLTSELWMLLRGAGAETVQDPGEEEGAKVPPLTKETIQSVYERLVTLLGLPFDWMSPPQFVVVQYVYYKDPSPPESLLLNSFFLDDLALVRRLLDHGRLPDTLQRYLQMVLPERTIDLLRDRKQLEEAVSPLRTSPAGWPHPGAASLVLLQQAAVNLARAETAQGRLVGVNGPPGTGKTTLLRDLIAAIVEERAARMAASEDPKEAFRHSGVKIRAGNAWIHLYSLDPSLRGFEILVASTNNKAVENISAEIPGKRAVCDANLAYFRTLSDALHETETWGAVAAVLGNAQNRAKFRQIFWWSEDTSLNSYLRAVVGNPVYVEEKDPATQRQSRRLARIIEAEAPPQSEAEALSRWNAARAAYRKAKKAAESRLRELEELRAAAACREKLSEEAGLAESALLQAEGAVDRHVESLAGICRQVTEAEASLQAVRQRLADHRNRRPGWFSWLLRRPAAKQWQAEKRKLERSEEDARQGLASLHAVRAREEAALAKAREEAARAAARCNAARQALIEAVEKIRRAVEERHIAVLDESVWQLPYGRWHLVVPWLDEAAQQERRRLFTAAVQLHRAFVDAAARPLRHNLSALMWVFARRPPPGARAALLPDLWASLFLVIPVISTTFASLGRMMAGLPEQSLGWLLMDEAGQAVPQAAVGGLLRCRRVVAVGDPVQLEPVVEMPDGLVAAICQRHGVDPEMWAAPTASVQTLADRACHFQTVFETETGSREAGIPLLVHRRCSEPMFTISNRIAYAGLMVPAKEPETSAALRHLGPSRWIHVTGSGCDKWCEEEGQAALELLRQFPANAGLPDLYILSPFVIVAQRMRMLLRSVWRSLPAFAGIEEENVDRWIHQRVGTVHTAQGREADAVILVLGAPRVEQTGARGWAGGKPNLLNVAVTRARNALYVVGNRDLWKSAGVFRQLVLGVPAGAIRQMGHL